MINHIYLVFNPHYEFLGAFTLESELRRYIQDTNEEFGKDGYIGQILKTKDGWGAGDPGHHVEDVTENYING